MPPFRLQRLAIAVVSAFPLFALAQAQPQADTSAPAAGPATPNAQLGGLTVTSKRLDAARNGLSPATGTSVYGFDASDVDLLPLGASTPINQVLLQAPGVVQDSYGQLHVRGDHANMQYRIDDVMIPEPITGFGPAIDSRFADSINLLTGALPAQYGYHTAGVVDIHTKDTAENPGGEIGTVIGSDGHREINGSVGATKGRWSYFFSGSALENNLGIENTTSATTAAHDHTDQGKGFGYLGLQVDHDNKLSLMLGVSQSKFQIPDVPGLQPVYSLANAVATPSADLNANQQEKNDFQVLSWRHKDASPLAYQISVYHRTSSVNYQPDPVGDLNYNGVASTINHSDAIYGTQWDASYKLNPSHTLRMGLSAETEKAVLDNSSMVFPADANGNQTSSTPINVVNNNTINGSLWGLYLQDEWKLSPKLTLNYGARFDHVNTVTTGQQLSPRLGLVYDWTDKTRIHAGYARYFTPPSTEKIDTTSVALFQNTTNALPSDANTAVLPERSHYFDIGLSHLVSSKLTLGLDAYYRQVQNLQDEGQFGNALVYSTFNYAQGRIGGIELSANYTDHGFAAYGNLTRSVAIGKNVETGQFNFSQDELNYIANNWVHLDHDQAWTASGGLSYRKGPTTYSMDMVYGSGLRDGFANTGTLPSYLTFNGAIAHSLDTASWGKFNIRLSVINLLDHAYELRDGTGIGVGAPQWGQRRTVYLSLSKPFDM